MRWAYGDLTPLKLSEIWIKAGLASGILGMALGMQLPGSATPPIVTRAGRLWLSSGCEFLF